MAKKKASKMKAGSARRVNDTTVSVNLKGIEGKRLRRVRIPEGNYLAKVHEATAKTAKTGNEMVEWILEIVEPDKYQGQRFWYNTVLTEQSLWNFRAVLEALGVKVKDSTMNIPLGRLAGRTCGIEIVDGEYEGKTRSEINDIFAEALLEEEDEDEETDDEDDWEDEEDTDEDEEEDDEDEDDDEEDEDEDEELDQDEVEALGIKELRQHARDHGVYKKGMKKDEILEALFPEDEDEDDEDEEWEDEEEIDLDEDEL